MKKISVIGAGAWGTALAESLAEKGEKVLLWAREPEVIASIREKGENSLFLPGIPLSPGIQATSSIVDCLSSDVNAVLLVVPTQFIRSVMTEIGKKIATGVPLVVCAKGIEQKTGRLISEVVEEVAPHVLLAFLSGPTFAEEVARKVPTAITLACRDEKKGAQLTSRLGTKTLRPYYSNDIIGVQVGGAVKNVMAIAAGILEGKKAGSNTKAALLTRGLAEIMRLGVALGGKKETLMGLSGMGDLVLTASSMQSRNFSLGVALGQGQKAKDVLSVRNSVAEGVYTASAVLERAKTLKIDMPICEALSDLLEERETLDRIIDRLMTRPLRNETA